MNFEISDLRERPEFFDTVADRIWRAWWEPRGHPLSAITGRLSENPAGPGIPIALIAHRGDEFLGTASLIASDLDERPRYSPWVAAVWTEPDARGQGIGCALVSRARDDAFALGHDKIISAPARRCAATISTWAGRRSKTISGSLSWTYSCEPSLTIPV